MSLAFETAFEPAYGSAVPVAENVLRVTVNNPSAFTFHGTNSYIIGSETLAIIDPGPEDHAHFETLMATIAGRPVSHIFVSHTHRDHSPLAARLKAATGAATVAEGPYRPQERLRIGGLNPLDASNDADFTPDLHLSDDQVVEGDGWSVRGVFTPGHAANHMAFALEGTGILFSADHVMAWATTIVAPPDGSMADYMASLHKLLARDDRIYFPGHGGPVRKPLPFLRGLKAHRKMRQRAILERLRAGDRTIAEMVAAIYRDTNPALHGAAGLSVLAHLEDLTARSDVVAETDVSVDGVFRPA